MWARRYTQLLKNSGLAASSILSQGLQAGPMDVRGFISLAQCLEQPSLLHDRLCDDYRLSNDPGAARAYLSVLHQDLALSVLGPLVLRLFRDGQAPVPSPEHIVLVPRNQMGTITSHWFMAPGQPAVTEATFIEQTDRQVTQWYPVFRKAFGVSPGAYWSSTGLGLGAPFSLVWNRLDPDALCQLAQQWLETFRNDSHRFIDWIPAVVGDQNTAIPQRKGCCLKYLLPEGAYCGTCGVYRKQRMAETVNHRHRRQETEQWPPGQP